METLKISFLSYMGPYPTPPIAYGGEIIYWNVVDELDKMGHNVTLYASPLSRKPEHGNLVEISSLHPEMGFLDRRTELANVATHLKNILSSDIVHDGSNFKCAHFFANTVGMGEKALAHLISVDEHNLFYPHHVVAISYKHAKAMESSFGAHVQEPIPHPFFTSKNRHTSIVNPVVVYPDIDLDLYQPCYDKEDYVIWVSRFHEVKGPVTAIEACAKAGVKLKMSGDITSQDHRRYFLEKVKPLMDKHGIEYVPTPDRTSLIRFLQKAKAFIFPVSYVEAFGYVVLESLACGTPVITTCNGAMSEIVEHGRSGFIVPNTVDAFAETLSRVNELKPEEARRRAERFKKGNGAREFYKLYKMMLDGKWPRIHLPVKNR